jgi:hypothetical protein
MLKLVFFFDVKVGGKMSENHLETCLYHLVGITEPVFKRLSATYDTPCIQGVSEFDRQTFRADSTIKNQRKTLNTYGVKNT